MCSCMLLSTRKAAHAKEWMLTCKENCRDCHAYTCFCVVVFFFCHSTLYGQKYWDTPLIYWIQVFQSDPLLQAYTIKHLDMQSAFTNLCEKMGYSEELNSSLCCDTGCHFCNILVHEILSLIDTPRSTVNGIIGKW